MKTFHKAAAAVLSLAVAAMVAACGSEQCLETTNTSAASTSTEAPIEATPVAMYKAVLDTPGVILGEDNYYRCGEGLRGVVINTSRSGTEINGTIANIDNDIEKGTIQVRFNGPLPEVAGAVLTAIGSYTNEQGDRKTYTLTFPANWLPGMETSLVFKEGDFSLIGDEFIASLTLCVR